MLFSFIFNITVECPSIHPSIHPPTHPSVLSSAQKWHFQRHQMWAEDQDLCHRSFGLWTRGGSLSCPLRRRATALVRATAFDEANRVACPPPLGGLGPVPHAGMGPPRGVFLLAVGCRAVPVLYVQRFELHFGEKRVPLW